MIRRRNHLDSQLLWLAGLDLLCIVSGVMGGILVRLGPDAIDEYFFRNVYGWVYLMSGIVVANYISGTYEMELRLSRFNMLVNWTFSIVVALLVVSTTSFAWFDKFLGRGVLLLALAVYSILWLCLRFLVYQYAFAGPMFALRVVIIGTGETARSLLQMVTNKLLRPVHRVLALVDVGDLSAQTMEAPGGSDPGVPVSRVSVDGLNQALRALDPDVIIMGMDDPSALDYAYPQLRRIRFEGTAVMSALTAAEVYSGRIPLPLVDENWLMQACMSSATSFTLRCKRIVDMVLALTASLLCMPLFVAIAVLIKLTAPRSPVFYSQMRVGQFGCPFRMYKFRTMTPQAEGTACAVWSPDGDLRITRVGAVLRRYRLDELPQFANIMRGDMSWVGPRPEQPEIASALERQIPHYRERENVLPGLTGWAQIRHAYGNTIDDARIKLEYDLYYVTNLSMGLDVRILLRTVRIVMFGLEREMR